MDVSHRHSPDQTHNDVLRPGHFFRKRPVRLERAGFFVFDDFFRLTMIVSSLEIFF